MAQSGGGIPTIINYFYSNKTAPAPTQETAVATLQLKPVDSTLSVLGDVEETVAKREAAIEKLRQRRATVADEARKYAQLGQMKKAEDTAKRVKTLDDQIKAKQLLCDTLRRDGEQLELGHDTRQTQQLRKAVVEEKRKLVKDMSLKDVDKTAALNEVCDEDVDMIFDRLTGVGVVDEEAVAQENSDFLKQLLTENQPVVTSAPTTSTTTTTRPQTVQTRQTGGRVTNAKIESLLNL